MIDIQEFDRQVGTAIEQLAELGVIRVRAAQVLDGVQKQESQAKGAAAAVKRGAANAETTVTEIHGVLAGVQDLQRRGVEAIDSLQRELNAALDETQKRIAEQTAKTKLLEAERLDATLLRFQEAFAGPLTLAADLERRIHLADESLIELRNAPNRLAQDILADVSSELAERVDGLHGELKAALDETQKRIAEQTAKATLLEAERLDATLLRFQEAFAGPLTLAADLERRIRLADESLIELRNAPDRLAQDILADVSSALAELVDSRRAGDVATLVAHARALATLQTSTKQLTKRVGETDESVATLSNGSKRQEQVIGTLATWSESTIRQLDEGVGRVVGERWTGQSDSESMTETLVRMLADGKRQAEEIQQTEATVVELKLELQRSRTIALVAATGLALAIVLTAIF